MLERATEWARSGRAFALVTVVRALPPTSGKPGDKAIVSEDGEWVGWVGGSCAEPTARRAARESIADGQSRLIQLSNDPGEAPRIGVERAAMTCHSGGTMELCVEPFVPAPDLIVFGDSPVASALCRIGGAMGYRVQRVVTPGMQCESPLIPVADPPVYASLEALELGSVSRAYVVVASHGKDEDDALAWAISQDVAYVGLVASRRRADAVRHRLVSAGISPTDASRVDGPAGLDIGARGPDEVALSVLCEIVRRARGARAQASLEAAAARADSLAHTAAPRPVASEPAPSCCRSREPAAERVPSADR